MYTKGLVLVLVLVLVPLLLTPLTPLTPWWGGDEIRAEVVPPVDVDVGSKVRPMLSPMTVKKYLAALREAKKVGYSWFKTN